MLSSSPRGIYDVYWPKTADIRQVIAFTSIAGDAGETRGATAAGLWPGPWPSAVRLANPARAVALAAPTSPGPQADDHAGATGTKLVGSRDQEISFTLPVSTAKRRRRPSSTVPLNRGTRSRVPGTLFIPGVPGAI